MTQKSSKRMMIGANAIELASEMSGEPTTQGLELGILKLQARAKIAEQSEDIILHLKTFYEVLATFQLMLHALTPKDETRIVDLVKRMSVRSEKLLSATADLSEITGTRLSMLADRAQKDQQRIE